PRYHAVDTALELGRITGAAVVLGSATPRVVTYEAARKGELASLALPERVGELLLPPTTVVDLRLELRTGNRGTLSQALREALQRMRSGDAQVIVGTQMLAKGFDLPRVTLVGVVNADTVLNLPDFTAAERTFQLLTQVLGRSGRGEAGGRGIVQTYLPEHYAIRAAAAHDYVAFAEAELEGRRRFGYPPFGRLALLTTQAKKLETVERRTHELAAWL